MTWTAWGTSLNSLVQSQALCLGAGAAVWALLGRVLHRPADDKPFALSWPALVQPFDHLASLVGLCALAGLTLSEAFATVIGTGIPPMGLLPWAALIAVALPFVLRLREDGAWLAREALYVLGLTAIGTALHSLGLEVSTYARSMTLALAPYVAFTALIAWWFTRRPELAAALGIRPAAERKNGNDWFVSAQTLVTALVASLGVWMALDGSLPLIGRLAGALTAAFLTTGFVLLAERAGESTISHGLRYAALGLGTLMAIQTGFAFLDPAGHAAGWLLLHRTVLLMVSLAAVTTLYGAVLAPRLSSQEWAKSRRRFAPGLGALAVAVLVAVMAQEAWLYTGEALGAPMATPAVVVVTLALIGLIASALVFAVAPGRDPLGLSERGRTAYVYAAELLPVLIFVHLRLTEPLLFHRGVTARYWPLILMGIAFLGALLSEYFQRRGFRVLAEPLERTGVVLPLLPMLAAWSVPTTNYAFIWFSAGLLYAMFSIRKQSFGFALVAALAANAGLWVLLYEGGVQFLRHPQFWLIPLAVILLVSEFYNRERLTASQSTTLRYLGLIVIYVSSTADMFISGVGNSALYPLILALLSVLGILSGMVLRIRAFLLLGISFLGLVLMTIIWHAGVDRGQTWILWSAGIALGMAILTLFGIFEKRRNDVLRVIENLKGWK
jgi:hypothetical protein